MLRAIRLIVLVVALGTLAQAQQEDTSLRGRLATVEPSARRIALVAEDDSRLTEVIVAEDGEILQDDERISLAHLVTLVGNRIEVRYRVEKGVRVARRLIVEREAQPRIPTSDPIRP